MTVLDGCDLSGRVALVIGAGSEGGIGYACVKAFATAGASVAAADLPGSAIETAVDTLPGAQSHTAHFVDVSDPASVNRLFIEVIEAHGKINILLNAAAILEVAPFLDTNVDSWERTFAVNARGTFLACQAAARQMVRQGTGGRIIAVASNVGRIPRLNNASYAASKAAVIHLVRCMALEVAPHNITVNALCPGSTATTMLVDVQARGDRKLLEGIIHGSIEQWRTGIPLGRLAEPSDQAAAATFLASDAARQITGQAMCVDGGQTLF